MKNEPGTVGPLKLQPFNRGFFLPEQGKKTNYQLVRYHKIRNNGGTKMVLVKDNTGREVWLDWETQVESM